MQQLNLIGEAEGTPLFSQPAQTLIHLTLTGPYAGMTLCTVNKAQAKARGDEFYHVMYWNQWDNPRLCPHCKAEWESTDDE